MSDFLSRRNRLILTCAIVLVFVVGCIYSLALGDSLRYLPDEADYNALANNLASQFFFSIDGKNPTAYRAPAYPLLLAGAHVLGGGILAYRLLNYALLAGSLVLVNSLLKKHFSVQAASLGVLAAAIYPLFFYTAGTLYPQSLAAFLFLLSLYWLTCRELGWLDFLWLGLTLGWLILTVPTFAWILAVYAIWVYFKARVRLGYILALAVVLVIVGVWTARNYAVYRSFVFVMINSGENLLRGNSENTTPSGGSNVSISKYAAMTSGMNDLERDRFYTSQAIAYIRDHKAETARMYLLKLANYFNFRNTLVTKNEASLFKDLLSLLSYGTILVLVVIRLLSIPRQRLTAFEALLLGLYFGNALISAVYYTRLRYRLPYDYLLILLVAGFLGQFMIKKEGKKS